MNEEIRQFIQSEIQRQIQAMPPRVPWVNQPLLKWEISIIGYKEALWAIPSLEARVTALEQA